MNRGPNLEMQPETTMGANHSSASKSHPGDSDEFEDAKENTLDTKGNCCPPLTSPAESLSAPSNSNGRPYSQDVIQISDDVQAPRSFDLESAIPFSLPTPKVSCGPNSFADPRDPIQAECPAPAHFSTKQLLQPLPSEKREILRGLEIQKDGCLVCTDQEALEKQKGVLGAVAKQLAVNLMKGLSISHISLPIKIFEPRSSIQRIVDFWSQAANFLNLAAESTDPVERMKWVVTFGLSSIYICSG